eukprot:gnl/TRDRNA2_/TRDRNA2_166721_c1_seq1.p2 gnl/TRDRNA2_/TRDRNA2_166721_c1~~gnl/TRDRNA2_/TRDRNA2_166721_c1_seq1.p2  ORF type:complete len:135 (-),score=27.10 gnl/TRDRNA2_/TRDRNA2_166721_c1_seq1:272-676(-)
MLEKQGQLMKGTCRLSVMVQNLQIFDCKFRVRFRPPCEDEGRRRQQLHSCSAGLCIHCRICKETSTCQYGGVETEMRTQQLLIDAHLLVEKLNKFRGSTAQIHLRSQAVRDGKGSRNSSKRPMTATESTPLEQL